ncbi:MAG: transcriptional repressor [Rickettsiales bacterium]|nr:transcriptional repressor [Rickettsiales bacterium]
MSTALKNADRICKAHGARLTDVRKQVLTLVWASHEPVKAYDLLAELQKEDANAKPPTVYRALDFLLAHGLIHKIHRLNAYVGCAHPNDETPCFFLICSECNTVTECHDKAYPKLIANVSRSQHFTPQAMSFELEGVCEQCG